MEVTVAVFSEFVQLEDVVAWMEQFCTVHTGHRVLDADGVKTGYFKVYVTLRSSRVTGQLLHIPHCIRVGPYQGTVYYNGQPEGRRGSYEEEEEEHCASGCQELYCAHCQKAGHEECLCSSTFRLFEGYPTSDADTGMQRAPQASLPAEEMGQVDLLLGFLEEQRDAEPPPPRPPPEMVDSAVASAVSLVRDTVEKMREESQWTSVWSPPT